MREHFDQAINVDHFREIYDLEFFEKKAVLQDRLHNLMVNDKNIEQIMNLSPYDDIRREAYKFLEYKVEPVSGLNHPYQRHLMDGSLNFFIQSLNEQEQTKGGSRPGEILIVKGKGDICHM